jgi:hypothetical protein
MQLFFRRTEIGSEKYLCGYIKWYFKLSNPNENWKDSTFFSQNSPILNLIKFGLFVLELIFIRCGLNHLTFPTTYIIRCQQVLAQFSSQDKNYTRHTFHLQDTPRLYTSFNCSAQAYLPSL